MSQWLNEPNELVWTDEATGLECLIMRMGNGGHLCGYVRVPDGHCLHGKDYSTEIPELEARLADMMDKPMPENPSFALMIGALSGGLSASMDVALDAHGGITFSGKRRAHDGWWIGFDCAHSGDLSPGLSFHTGGVYRDMEYVKAECVKLAGQVAALASKESEQCEQ